MSSCRVTWTAAWPTLEWIADQAPDVKVSLWDEYVPPAEGNSAPRAYVSLSEEKNRRYAWLVNWNFI